MLNIRHALEKAIQELTGKILGSGAMMVPPYTMDFSFILNDKEYSVSIKPILKKE